MGVEAVVMKPVLDIKLSDLFRATMADDCGNEGFIGIAPVWCPVLTMATRAAWN